MYRRYSQAIRILMREREAGGLNTSSV